MKQINFGYPGKFPLTQDTLGLMQTAYLEQAKALALAGAIDDGTPVILTGMVRTGNAITDGYFFLSGAIIYCPAVDLGGPAPSFGNSYAISIVTTTENVTYRNGDVNDAISTTVGAFSIMPNGDIDSDEHYFYVDFRSYGEIFGARYRTGWATLAVVSAGAGDVNGSIYYKKDIVANTLLLRWALNVDDAQSLDPALTASFTDLQTLAAEFRPATRQFFTAHRGSSGYMPDSTGDTLLKQFTGVIGDDGIISIELIKPDAGIAAYSVAGNCVVSLD